MRVRTKLILAIAVPVGLLVAQIVVVNAFVRELQSAVSFIASAHKVIEADFVATELVETMRAEVKQLPGRYVTEGASGGDDEPLRQEWKKLTAEIDLIAGSDATKSIDAAILEAVTRAYDTSLAEYRRTEAVIADDAVDMDTLIERAIFIDKALVSMSDALQVLAVELRKQLQIAVDREREIHDRPVIAGIAIGGLAVLLLLAFTWLVVDRFFVARLTGLSRSMLAIARGNLRSELPTDRGSDEISEMAEALTVFRDTAIEVEESNLREITSARQRLGDAIEAISEGFSLYDPDDRLVVSNTRYREILHADNELMQPGQGFRDILSAAIERGFIADAQEDAEHWLEARLARHHNPGAPHVQRYANGRWVRVTERRTRDGGTVAVYSDITELKQREEELAAKSSQLEQLSNQLAKYLSPQVYDSIFQGRQEVKIAASRKKLTVFFSDIAGFTETADRLESEELTQLLNHYLTEMSRIALEHGATIDKYVGDAILIFFGDPETRGVREDARACLRMAVAMRERMRELEGVWRAAGIARPLRCRMGIHTDFCTVGNFGSEDRLDYTIIGRGVNTASRLESLAEPGEILISYETYAHVADEIACDERGEVEVKGLAYPVTAYQVVGPHDNVAQTTESVNADLAALLRKDPDKMTDLERRVAITRLSGALEYLSQTHRPS
jgi:class 3 adenylate cyclase/PAS domain-containing protein